MAAVILAALDALVMTRRVRKPFVTSRKLAKGISKAIFMEAAAPGSVKLVPAACGTSVSLADWFRLAQMKAAPEGAFAPVPLTS